MKFIPEVSAIGVTNRTADNKHVIFLDYDNVQWLVIRKDIDMLVNEFKASNFFILRTGPRAFHAVSLTKYSFTKMKELVSYTHEDDKHQTLPYHHNRRSTVLRISGKYDLIDFEMMRTRPSYLETYPVKPINMQNDISSAHYEAYKRWFGVDCLPYQQEDGATMIELVGYKTMKGDE